MNTLQSKDLSSVITRILKEFFLYYVIDLHNETKLTECENGRSFEK